ncbi:VOC family protein [Virgibacillus sp. LDC-1]|uniref:VOC family protein n=1 Tax=Virgibacillus sp. LDC-1 TaxID=3039856 RepID=UPI0024DE0116|nr:VOC family protein [Virgibacillus sp. LDC-1]
MMFQYEGLDHVQLAAPKNYEARARAFYQDVLGFVEKEKPVPLKARGGVWFQAGIVQIHIGVEEGFIPARKAHPAIRVRYIDRLKERLDNNHIVYIEDEHLPGANRFYTEDPFGNRLEFIEWENKNG